MIYFEFRRLRNRIQLGHEKYIIIWFKFPIWFKLTGVGVLEINAGGISPFDKFGFGVSFF